MDLDDMDKHKHGIGIFEAKTHFSDLVGRVERGETIVITRHGAPVARIVPYDEDLDREEASKALREIVATSKGRSLGGVTLREVIEEGRRF